MIYLYNTDVLQCYAFRYSSSFGMDFTDGVDIATFILHRVSFVTEIHMTNVSFSFYSSIVYILIRMSVQKKCVGSVTKRLFCLLV